MNLPKANVLCAIALLGMWRLVAHSEDIAKSNPNIAFPDAPFEMPAITVPQFALRDFSIADFGAKEGEKATEAFVKAMAACEAAGGGRVVVPKGT